MLTHRLADARGSALVTALILMSIMLALGASAAVMVQGDQSDSRRERERESSFQLAEGVLNAQIYRLSTRWPGRESAPYQTSCVASSTSPDCPGGTTLQQNFLGPDYNRPVSWSVQVRDNDLTSGAANYYTDAVLTTTVPRDENGDNFIWVRAQADVAGHRRTLVALVEAEDVPLAFPRAALVAGHFKVSNNGNKVMIDTNGESNEFTPGDIIVRCSIGAADCDDWNKDKGQVEPNTVKSNLSQPNALTPEALEILRERAKAQGNWYAGCAPSLEGRGGAGEIVFMENAEGCRFNGNDVYNTVDKPGYVVIGKGTPTLNGNAEFHGVIYHANTDNSNATLVELTGNISVYGAIVIDGNGGLSAGSSKLNLVYDPNTLASLKAFGTAGIVQKTFREISASN
jgi:type II secretory pathway pseudopilin PulG